MLYTYMYIHTQNTRHTVRAQYKKCHNVGLHMRTNVHVLPGLKQFEEGGGEDPPSALCRNRLSIKLRVDALCIPAPCTY